MKIELTEKQLSILWILANTHQRMSLTSLEQTLKQKDFLGQAKDNEDLKHITTVWLKETREEFDMLQDIKTKVGNILFKKK